MSPLDEVKVMFGAVTPLARTSEIEALELMVTKLLPTTPAPKVTVVPAAVFADRVTPYPVIGPDVEMLPAVASRENVLPTPPPELLALRVTVPAALSEILTDPVEVAVTVVAFVELAAETFMPTVPALRLIVAELSTPPVVMPLPT